MAAKKLRASLRDSVIAEKSSIDHNSFAVNKESKTEALAEKQLEQQTKLAAANSTKTVMAKVVSQPASAKTSTRKIAAVKKPAVKFIAPTAPTVSRQDSVLTVVSAKVASTANFNPANPGVGSLSNLSHEFTSLYLASIKMANNSLTDYVNTIVKVKDFAAVYNANVEFLNKLRQAQQELLLKNTQLFKQIKALILPSAE